MTNPIDDIEGKQGNIDMGRLAAQVFEGAYQESGSMYKAFFSTSAFFVGMFSKPQDEDSDGT